MAENNNNSPENAPVQNGEYSPQSPSPASASGDSHADAPAATAGQPPQPDAFSSPLSGADDAQAMPGSTADADEVPAAYVSPNPDIDGQGADGVGAAVDDLDAALGSEGQGGQIVSLLAAARERTAELENALVRAQADMENIKRRCDRQVSDAHKYAVERFSLEVLLLRDHMEMGAHSLNGLDISNDEAYATIRKGFDMVIDSFPTMLKRFNIVEIDCLGKLFDPNLHEAVGQAEDSEVEAGHVATVRQRGYTIGERLLRPALVVVAK
ncbi:MAG: nucleotide exchange factor GrpE [Proteobacteria bacterium]|nr:nucleotide exchange factor GrpE [Pseudomonadota bacterium]